MSKNKEQQQQPTEFEEIQQIVADILPQGEQVLVADTIAQQSAIVEGRSDPLAKVDDIPWDATPGPNDKAVTIAMPRTIIFAEGLELPVTATDEEFDKMDELIQSYVGVKPDKVGDHLGEWIEVIGCALVPFEREIKRKEIDPETGEHYTALKKWKAPMFKLAETNKQGQHKILSGGGGSAVDWIKRQSHFGRAGDWRYPRLIMFSQEERRIVDVDTGEEKPGRMYRIDVRSL